MDEMVTIGQHVTIGGGVPARVIRIRGTVARQNENPILDRYYRYPTECMEAFRG